MRYEAVTLFRPGPPLLARGANESLEPVDRSKNLETIDSGLRLVAAPRHAARERTVSVRVARLAGVPMRNNDFVRD